MSWLVCGGDVLASLEIAEKRADRRRGLLGRNGVEGALMVRPARTVHTLGMRFAIDVAWCDSEMIVVRMATVPRYRVTLPVWSSRAVIEAEAGSFERWGLAIGDQLVVKS